MDIGTLATIIILAILTVVIFAFAWVVFHQIRVNESEMIAAGNRDLEISIDKEKSRKLSYKIANVFSSVLSYILAGAALVIMIFALVTHFKGELFYIGGRTAMVVASDSMSTVYDRDTQAYLTDEMVSQEFSRGDILYLDSTPSEDTIVPDRTVKDADGSISSPYRYKVMAYKASTGTYKGSYIIHRLYYVGLRTDETTGEESLYYNFRGDANNSRDAEAVSYSQINGVYDGTSKSAKVGYFVLFFESAFGIYAVLASIIMVSLSTIYTGRIQKQYDERWEDIDHHRLTVYGDIKDIRAKVRSKWAGDSYELRDMMGELKERVVTHNEEVKAKIKEDNAELKEKIVERHEEVKAKLEEKKPEAAKPIESKETPIPEPAKAKEDIAKPAETPTATQVETKKPEVKEKPKKVFSKKNGVFVKIVKSGDDTEIAGESDKTLNVKK